MPEVCGNNLPARIQADWPGTPAGGKPRQLSRHLRELRPGGVVFEWWAVLGVPESGVAAAGPEDREGKRGVGIKVRNG